MELLDVWVRTDLFTDHHRPCPLLMHLSKPDTHPHTLFWNDLRRVLPQLVKVHFFTDLSDAGDIVVVPHDAKEWLAAGRFKELRKFVKDCLATGRTVVTFALGIEYEPQPGEIAFITSAYRTKGEKALPLPSWLYDIGAEVTPVPKPAHPTITFMGNTEYKGRIGELLTKLPLPSQLMTRLACSRVAGRLLPLNFRFAIARWLRRRAVSETRHATQLESHLVERNNFFVYSPEEMATARAEYLQSIQNHAYALCLRGDANGDYRTYEILSAGRIPVIADTRLRFPDLEGMEWRDFCVFMPVTQLHRIGETVADFHAQQTEEDFQAKCRMAREAFEQLLPHRYIHRIIGEVRKKAEERNRRANPARQLEYH